MELGKLFGFKKDGKTLVQIGVDKLVPNPFQPRRVFDSGEIAALAESIRKDGILQPLCIRKREDMPEAVINGQRVTACEKYEIIAGERRWRAAKLAGLKTVPCILMTASNAQSARMALAENIFRADLDFFEQALAMQNIMIICGFTQTQLGESLGLSQSTVANKLRLLRFSEEERRLIRESEMPERVARQFLRVGDDKKRRKLLLFALTHELSGEDCEAFIESRLDEAKTQKGKKKSATQKLTGTVSDVRFFMNSIDKAIFLAGSAGYPIERKETDCGDYVELRLMIPKSKLSK